VNLAITLSTLTTMVVFLPVILMSENADFSFFLGEIGMPVVWALAASLAVALIFTPLSTTLLKGSRALPEEPRWIRWLTERYAAGLNWVLTHRTDALMGVVAFSIFTYVLPFRAVGCEDEGGGNLGEFVVRYEVPADFSYRERLEVVETLEAWVEDNREEWGVRTHRADLRSNSNHGRIYV
jgi:multidrug efflux pump subunit AcrB